jgi:NAD(P)H-dependent flavin oxidoreductase YrpB (nitropropane dioxygenase family)
MIDPALTVSATRTRFCATFGVQFPIIQAPLGPNISGVELASTVSEAGGLGILQAQLASPDMMRSKIREIRQRTKKPFGVNFILRFPSEHLLDICLEEGVPVISFFWGDPAPYVRRCHAAAARVMHQVGSIDAARQAADVGVDLIVAQGVEAGGHVAGSVSTLSLVPRIVDVVRPTLVAAAGGIADARGLLAALQLGAEAVAMGTRFLATPEANIHPRYRSRLLVADTGDTVVSTLFGQEWPDAPHRSLRTALVEEWLARDGTDEARRPDQPAIGETRIANHLVPLKRFMGFPPCAAAVGDIDQMCLAAGQSVGLVNDVQPAADILRDIMRQAESLIRDRTR